MHQAYDSFSSPPEKHQGVAIYYRKEIKMIPFMPDKWTGNFITTRVGKTIFIAAYVNPNNKETLLEELLWIIGSV